MSKEEKEKATRMCSHKIIMCMSALEEMELVVVYRLRPCDQRQLFVYFEKVKTKFRHGMNFVSPLVDCRDDLRNIYISDVHVI